MKIALKLAYLGQNYYGLQKQPDLITIDSAVRKALLRIGVINGDFCYAGRTDRGVNALGQVIDFWIDEDKAHLAAPRIVNSSLPRDIWAWAHAIAPIGFSARWNATWREYRYILYHEGLDLDSMREAAELIRGEHDFRNFSSAKEDTIRDVTKLTISGQDGVFLIDVRARGFLWNMVRKVSSALEMVGSGEKDLEWICDLLNPEINHGAPTAPAEGLILMDVGYNPELDWHMDEYSRKKAAKALLPAVRKQMALGWAEKSLYDAMKDN
jgi:tRNA pseudouridine38-40 synthase